VAVDVPPPNATAAPDTPSTASPARRQTGLVLAGLVLAGLLVVGLVAAGAAWALLRDRGPDGPVAEAWSLEPHQGLGAWVDAFDWSHALGGETPVVDEDDFGAMADLGIQTVYLQTSHLGVPDQIVLEQDLLEGLIDAAHDNGLSVVAWYLPRLEDVDVDLERLLASAALDVDGLAVDIESTAVEDPAERNARLLELGAALRDELPDRVIAGITPSAVHLQVVNPAYWPDFPWVDVAETYDVLVPMTYWSIRLPEWRDGNRYVGENIDRIRAATANPELPLHVIGGIADGGTVEQVQGMLQAIDAREGVLGASLYDWATASPQQWAALGSLRDRNPAGGSAP
jgi:hypothetical protein